MASFKHTAVAHYYILTGRTANKNLLIPRLLQKGQAVQLGLLHPCLLLNPGVLRCPGNKRRIMDLYQSDIMHNFFLSVSVKRIL